MNRLKEKTDKFFAVYFIVIAIAMIILYTLSIVLLFMNSHWILGVALCVIGVGLYPSLVCIIKEIRRGIKKSV